MNIDDARHALELYGAISSIDAKLEHIASMTAHHRIIANVWASVPTGNYPIEIEVRANTREASQIVIALRSTLLADRELRSQGLRDRGFDVPPVPKERE